MNHVLFQQSNTDFRERKMQRLCQTQCDRDCIVLQRVFLSITKVFQLAVPSLNHMNCLGQLVGLGEEMKMAAK